MMKIHDVPLAEYGEASSIPSPVNRLMTDSLETVFVMDAILISVSDTSMKSAIAYSHENL